jgi:hypothetical protein
MHPFTADDHRQMERLGIAPEEALRQLELLRNPPPFTRVLRPCTLGDGVRGILPGDEAEMVERHDRAARAGRIRKLVPASGAASRMFRSLSSYLERLERAGSGDGGGGSSEGSSGGGAGGTGAVGGSGGAGAGGAGFERGSSGGAAPEPGDEVGTFFAQLPRFAFYEALAAAVAARGVRLDLPEIAATATTAAMPAIAAMGAPVAGAAAGGSGPGAALSAAERQILLACLLTGAGLDYAEQPKGLILFHRHPAGARTPFEEHLVEAAAYARDGGGVCRLHFTVSPQHEDGFRALLAGRGAALERHLGCRFDVEFSHQRRATDTLAVDAERQPFRHAGGGLLFRPGGHGALLDNLQSLADGGAGIVLLKNIDNVVPDRLKAEVIRWKKLLGGALLGLQEGIFRLLQELASDLPDEELIDEAARFAEHELSRPLPARFSSASPAEQRHLLVAALDRPLRVAGVVPVSGEPGGGPFWVESAAGEVSLQIVEASQIGPEADQQAALAASSHFNPVDLACSVHDRFGRPYDLARFVDHTTVFIAERSHEGRPLRSLERPGLWNGAMAGWNTVFVEVPGATFAPVKTVLDLLRPEHQG